MKTINQFRNAVREVPDVADRARESLASLDNGVRRANVTMAILGAVAIAALGVAVVALLRASVVAR